MRTLKVELDGKAYPLFIGTHILAKLGEVYQLYGFGPRAALITNSRCFENRYYETVIQGLKRQNINIFPFVLTPAELQNGLVTVQQLALRLADHQFHAREPIIAIGDSIVNSIGGFLARMSQGGVPYLQLPTTLTAQVSQSIDPIYHLGTVSRFPLFSLKVQRQLVWTDVALLTSLPERDFLSGMSYMIQFACLAGETLFARLEHNLKRILALNLEIIEDSMYQICQSRINFLKQNQATNQAGNRYLFGEFTAKIVMSASENKIKYGEALLLGMLVEATVALKAGIFHNSQFERFYELLIQIPCYHFNHFIDQNKIANLLQTKLSHPQKVILQMPQQFGKLKCYHAVNWSDFIAALELNLANL